MFTDFIPALLMLLCKTNIVKNMLTGKYHHKVSGFISDYVLSIL